jgi:L-malate glycosyltransferase
LHLPPPVHGASMMGRYVRESELINNRFQCDYINLSTSKHLKDIGRSAVSKLFIFVKLYFKVFFAVLRRRYDLCYLTISSKGAGYYKDVPIVFILKLFRCNIVYHYHNKGVAENQNRWFPNLLYRFQFRNSNAILLSPVLYDDVKKYLPGDRTYFCANGIPADPNIDLTSMNAKRDSKPVCEILFLSNMIREKGVFTLLEACKLLHSRGIKFRTNFVGEWMDIKEEEFQEYVSSNNLGGSVFYEGKKYGRDKIAYFESADIFVFPTYYHNEAFPLVILEAMQFGLPVISTREGGIADMISENESGYLIKRQDATELADKIQDLIEDSSKRKNMGTASKMKFDRLFSLGTFESNLEKTFTTVIQKKGLKVSSPGPKKVLFICKFISHYRVEFYEKLREGLKQYNVEVHVIYGKSVGNDSLKRDEAEIEWGKFVPNKWFEIGKTQLIWQPYLKYLKGMDLVVVALENKLILNYYLMIARKFSRYKLAFWGHGRNMQSKAGSIANKYKSFYLRRCDWWFAYTKGVKQIVAKHFPENKITVVQNAIDTINLKKYYNEIDEMDLKTLKEELGITGCKVGIYCGGMYPEKRIDFIIEVCKKIRKEIPDFHMIFVGSGVDSYKAVEAAKAETWIHYIGPKLGKDRVKYFKISSIQIMPGLVGLGILDSFALETPIITTNYPFHSPEIDYLENGINGFVTNNNIEDYSKTVIEVLKTKKYLDLIEGCKVSSEKYTIEAMAENFKNGILSCLKIAV